MSKLCIALILFTISSCDVTPNQAITLTQSWSNTPDYGNLPSNQFTDTQDAENSTDIFVSADSMYEDDSLSSNDSNTASAQDVNNTADNSEPELCGICADGFDQKEEECNGLDDDCDCQTDEDWADLLGMPCRGYIDLDGNYLEGHCTEVGVIVCDDSPHNVPIACSSAAVNSRFSTPDLWVLPDDCDLLDTDCDGLIDEDCIPPGPCGICADGLEQTEETCNYKDDDCDCEVDEDFDLYHSECIGFDQYGLCTESGWLICNVGGETVYDCWTDHTDTIWENWTLPGEQEKCNNGFDDNCDGQIDEGCEPPTYAEYCEPVMYPENYMYGYQGCCGTFQETDDPQPGMLITGNNSSQVFYYFGENKRFVFNVSTILDSWYAPLDANGVPQSPYHEICNEVHLVSDERIQEITLSGVVLLRPGAYITGTILDEETLYVVSDGLTLREAIPSSLLESIYPGTFSDRVKYLPSHIFNDYYAAGIPGQIGDPVTSVVDFSWEELYYSADIEFELQFEIP